MIAESLFKPRGRLTCTRGALIKRESDERDKNLGVTEIFDPGRSSMATASAPADCDVQGKTRAKELAVPQEALINVQRRRAHAFD